ncbi:nuclear mRNA export, poly(A)+RNA binding protein [Lambiella insularis]|nr:nuclear mRNA export, poly(A)+RNA binding protein [Lambiella insularis]
MENRGHRGGRGGRGGRNDRGGRGGRGGNNYRGPSHGGIQKQRGGLRRVDKDGDLVDMGVGTGFTRGSGRGGRGGHNPSNQNNNNRGGRNGIDPSVMHKAVIRGMNSGSAVIKARKTGVRIADVRAGATGKGNNNFHGGLDEITVMNLKESEVAKNEQGGIKDLKNFLEKKVNQKKGQNEQDVRIIRYRWDGDAVILSVKPKDTSRIQGLDGIQFAKAKLSLKTTAWGVEGKSETTTRSTAVAAVAALAERMAVLIQRRFDPGTKRLNLSSLATDPDLGDDFTKNNNQATFFAQLMQICDDNLNTPELKRDTIDTISLASNNLADVNTVTTLAQSFPDLLNLDLSNNNLKALSGLEAWRWKFRSLDALNLSGNPLITEIPAYQNEVMKWFPKLRFLNQDQIRSDEQAAAAKGTIIPLPILGPSFGDETSVAVNFVRGFFPRYDSNRALLAGMFYDADSTFSVIINPHGRRAPGQADVTKQEWDAYSTKSHNITKMTILPGQVNKVNRGTAQIRDCWQMLPNTRHPDTDTEPEKWHMDLHSVPGVPDTSGQSAEGELGLLVTVHGQFGEVNVTTGAITAQRSFDRTFVLGPGEGVGKIRVISDVLVIGPYGGFETWKHGGIPMSQAQTLELPQLHHAHAKSAELHLPEGFGMELVGKPDQQVQKEKMAIELTKVTKLTLMKSGTLLQNVGWDLVTAIKYFETWRTTLQPEDFISEN